ncbi:hypothetical protein SSX86_011200 [Deinandra increscens subsp. villosa]|uniref:Uncharacterized protein n=1 Tax=Deinandra increscens subsp. villosa TaxID=3103831 RepID=A0AAP0H100_9ASTR
MALNSKQQHKAASVAMVAEGSSKAVCETEALLWSDMVALFAIYVMMNYLTDVWNLSTTHASGIINIWNGITPALTIVFAVFVDTFMSHFVMLGLSSIAFTIGLGLLSMSTPPVFGQCSDYKEECIGHTQKVLFFISLPLISVGMAGHQVSIGPFSRQQGGIASENENEIENKTENENKNDNKNEKENEIENENENKNKNENENENENENQKKSKEENENEKKSEEEKGKGNITPMQAKGFFMVIGVLVVGGIGLPYIKPWSLRFAIPAICSVVATLWFFSGFRDYIYIQREGNNPLAAFLRVFVATASNISKPFPDPKDLNNEENVHSTSTLRCFDKAAIKLPEEQQMNKWKFCSVREVEDAKIGIRMLPVWLTFIVIGIVLSIGNTYFLEQANHMDRKLGKLTIPIPFFLLFYKGTLSISTSFYSLLTIMFKKKYAPPIGIATSMVFAVLCCITSAKVETRRLHRIRDHGLLDKPDERIPMSIFALLPQFMLLAAVDGIANRSISGFFKHQTPEPMHKYLTFFTNGVLGLGSMASVLSVYVVGKVSERNHKPNWFQYTLNKSRLDRYYMVLAGLSAANLVIYVIVAYFYKYKDSPDDNDDDEVEGVIEEGFEDKKCCCF